MKKVFKIFIVVIILVMAWQALVMIFKIPPFILPGPIKVIQAFIDNAQVLIDNTYITMLEIVFGMLIGTFIGALTAIFLAGNPSVREVFMPILVFSQAIPTFALAPILTLWLGYGMLSKVATAVIIIFFPVTSNFLDGLLRTPHGFLDLAHTMGASKRSTMWKIRIPAAFPSLASGVQLAAVYAPIGAIIGEWVGASKGLGYLMLLANGRAKTDLMFASLFTLATFSILFYVLVKFLCQHYLLNQQTIHKQFY